MSDQASSQLFLVEENTIVLLDQPGFERETEHLTTGTIVDHKYEILGLLGEGGMGVVYLVRHLMLDKRMALKTFRSGNTSAESCLRFRREANAIARINHENVIQVFDFGITEDGFSYYTMEHLQGQTLAEKLRAEGTLKIENAIACFVPAGLGLSLAHSKGIVHRDIKPSNIFLVKSDSSDKVKIVDFGIASLSFGQFAGQKVTAIGTIVGSPLYMSPEQSLGKSITAQADIYSLGCALFESVVGKAPFLGATAVETLMMHHNCLLPTMKEASGGKEFPIAFEQVVSKMLSKSCADRHSSMEEVTEDLSAFLNHNLSPIANLAIQNTVPIKPVDGPDKLQKSDSKSLQFTLVAGAVAIVLAVFVVSLLYKQERQKVSNSLPPLARTKSLSRSKLVQELDNKQYLSFEFPAEEEYGIFYGPDLPDGKLSAKGKVKFLANQQYIFQPNSLFLKDLANFDIFLPEIEMGLDFSNAHPTGASKYAVLQKVSSMKKLWMLDLESSEIVDADLIVLRNLRNLRRLDVNYTSIHGSTLAKYDQIRRLKRLEFSGCSGASDLLVALSGSSNLTHLYLENLPLKPADFKLIAQIPNLLELHVDGSGMRSSDLTTLCELKKLNLLYCHELRLSPQNLDVVRKMCSNSLTWLYISGRGLSISQKTAMKKICPSVTFFELEKNLSETVNGSGFEELYQPKEK